MSKKKRSILEKHYDFDEDGLPQEKELADDMPEEAKILRTDFFKKWWPIVNSLNDPGSVTVENITSRIAPLSLLKLVELMMYAKSEKVQAECAKDIAYMAGYKPVERSQNLNVNLMARNEAAALLASKLEPMGIIVSDKEEPSKEILPPESLNPQAS